MTEKKVTETDIKRFCSFVEESAKRLSYIRRRPDVGPAYTDADVQSTIVELNKLKDRVLAESTAPEAEGK